MSSADSDVAQGAELLMAILAGVSEEMNDLVIELRERPGVVETRRGSDLRKYRDEFRFEDKPYDHFGAYVEADTNDGNVLCWFVTINNTPSGWELERIVSRNSDAGYDAVTEFETLTSDSFSEFAGKVPSLVKELAESARRFQFDSNESGPTRQLP